MLVAGAFGIGAGAGAGAASVGADTAQAAPEQIRLYGHNWVLHRQDRKPGARLAPGERGSVYGDLVDEHGSRVGSFYGSRMAVQSGLAGPVEADGSMELHTFKLEGGTLLGVGSSIDGESIFAIAGGTGTYAGMRGTYIAEQHLRELGGDGTAAFTINPSPQR